MNKAAFLIALVLALTACGAGSDSSADRSGEPPLAGARIGGPFTLTDQDGKPRSWESFQGKYRLVYFGYTYCPDICPLDLQKIMAGYRQFAKTDPGRAAKVQPMMISVDPTRDTPAVMKAYVANFPPNLIGLTGTDTQIAAVAKAFAVVYGRDDERGAKDYLVNHSRTPFLFGPAGEPIALVPTDVPSTEGDEGAPDKIAEELAKWVR